MTYVKVNSQGGINAYAPSALEIEGMVHYHPSDADYEAQGWLRYIDTPRPEEEAGEGLDWACRTADDGQGNCVVIWEAEPAPDAPDAPVGGIGIQGQIDEIKQAILIITEGE